MRPHRSHVIVRFLVLGFALAFVVPSAAAWADSRSDARGHYQSGVKSYNSGDYKAAIREFSQAQALAPADLNNYNLALCYDKLGDAEPAIQYYRAYLDKAPSTDKRAEIEASVKRLESAAKSVATKKAEEDRKAEEARNQIEASKAAEQARKAEEAAKQEDARRKAEEAARNTKPEPSNDGRPGVGVGIGVGVGSTGTPSSGATQTTGDAQLDRVGQINVNEIRDQRVGGAASGIPSPKHTPGASVRTDDRGAGDPPVATSTPRGSAPHGAPATDPVGDKPPPTPVYKKWWFWAVVAVAAVVVYSIATDGSKSSNNQGRMVFPMGTQAAPQPGGLTLMRW